MNTINYTLLAPIRAYARFWRALELTTQVAREAAQVIRVMGSDWKVGPPDYGYPPAPGLEILLEDAALLPSGSFAAIISKDGEIGELPPDVPENLMATSTGEIGRRAAAFRRYWVARVHQQYPRVVGCWDEASLACTRLFLCKIMAEGRKYYVEDRRDGKTVLVPKFKQPMYLYQIEACVDWLVTAAHMGTPKHAVQQAVRADLKPNWLMRMLGLKPGLATW